MTPCFVLTGAGTHDSSQGQSQDSPELIVTESLNKRIRGLKGFMNTFSQTTKHNKKPALAEPFCFLEQHNWQRFYIIIFFKTLKKYCFEPDW